MKIVFLGSADFGLPTLKRLIDDGHEIAAIVTIPDKPSGRGLHLHESPVATFAEEKNIWPILKPEKLKDPALIETLRSINADLFVVVAFRILPAEIFGIPKFGTFNIHAALLPRYRGPAPIQRAIEAGEKKSGVTVFRIDSGIDTGEILHQLELDIRENETTSELYERLSAEGASAISLAISQIGNGAAKFVVQDESQTCPAPKLRKDEAKLDWNADAKILFNRIRAFKPFPGTYGLLDGMRLGIESAEVQTDPSGKIPGTIFSISKDCFHIACGSGSLRVLSVKPEGKKPMSAGEFLRGRNLSEGTILQ